MSAPTNQASIDTLFVQYAPEIRRYLMNRLNDGNRVDDIIQSTFLKLNEHIDSVNLPAVRAWLYRVATNESNMILRRKKVESRAWKSMVETQDIYEESSESFLIRQEKIQSMRKLLDELPDKHRVIVKLKFYQGLTFAEIARKLEIPLGTVLSRMRAAMSTLTRYCEQSDLNTA